MNSLEDLEKYPDYHESRVMVIQVSNLLYT
jgi:hypothetical protein